MQLSIVEFARDVIGYTDAHSVELKPDTTQPVIHLMPDQEGIDDIGGTLRLILVFLIKQARLTSFMVKSRFMSVIVIVMKLIMITEKFLQKTA